MFFKQLFDPGSCTFSYLIADDTTHEAVLIDPVIDQVERDLQLLRGHGLALKHVLETHVHADHVSAALAIKQATGAQTAVSRDCNAHGYDRALQDGDVILFGHEEILVIATPGHTPGSVSYLWRDRVFTGDTLLIGGSFAGGSRHAQRHVARTPGAHCRGRSGAAWGHRGGLAPSRGLLGGRSDRRGAGLRRDHQQLHDVDGACAHALEPGEHLIVPPRGRLGDSRTPTFIKALRACRGTIREVPR